MFEVGGEVVVADVHAELHVVAVDGDGSARAVEQPGHDVGVGDDAVLLVGDLVPRHDEVAAVAHGHRRMQLVAAGSGVGAGDVEGVDAEFAAHPLAVAVVDLAVDVVEVAVRLALGRPDDDEVAEAVHGHGGGHLVVDGVGVDAELAADLLPDRVEPLAVDSPTAVGGPGPGWPTRRRSRRRRPWRIVPSVWLPMV